MVIYSFHILLNFFDKSHFSSRLCWMGPKGERMTTGNLRWADWDRLRKGKKTKSENKKQQKSDELEILLFPIFSLLASLIFLLFVFSWRFIVLSLDCVHLFYNELKYCWCSETNLLAIFDDIFLASSMSMLFFINESFYRFRNWMEFSKMFIGHNLLSLKSQFHVNRLHSTLKIKWSITFHQSNCTFQAWPSWGFSGQLDLALACSHK